MSHGRPGTRAQDTTLRRQWELELLIGVPSGRGLAPKGAWKQEGINERAGLAPTAWMALSKEEVIQTPSRHLFSAFGDVLSMLKMILFSRFPFPPASSFTS